MLTGKRLQIFSRPTAEDEVDSTVGNNEFDLFCVNTTSLTVCSQWRIYNVVCLDYFWSIYIFPGCGIQNVCCSAEDHCLMI